MICTNPNFVLTHPYSFKSAPLSDPNIFIILEKTFLLVRKCMLFHHPYHLQFAGEEGLLSSPACAVPELAKPPTPPSSDPTLQPFALPPVDWIVRTKLKPTRPLHLFTRAASRRHGPAFRFVPVLRVSFLSSSSIFIFNPWEVARFLVTMAAFDHLPPPGPPPPPRPRRRRLPPPEPPPNNH